MNNNRNDDDDDDDDGLIVLVTTPWLINRWSEDYLKITFNPEIHVTLPTTFMVFRLRIGNAFLSYKINSPARETQLT